METTSSAKHPSSMAVYTCPTCGERMERDLLLFIQHTDRHIIEALKESHPEWITSDGFCPKCLDHYQKMMRGLEAPVNIAGREITKRKILGLAGLAAASAIFFWLWSSGADRLWRLGLFFPIAFGVLNFFEVRNKHCVVLAMKGTQNVDGKERPVTNPAIRKALERLSRKIFLVSFLIATLLVLIAYAI